MKINFNEQQKKLLDKNIKSWYKELMGDLAHPAEPWGIFNEKQPVTEDAEFEVIEPKQIENKQNEQR